MQNRLWCAGGCPREKEVDEAVSGIGADRVCTLWPGSATPVGAGLIEAGYSFVFGKALEFVHL
jgi:hypothetical protein